MHTSFDVNLDMLFYEFGYVKAFFYDYPRFSFGKDGVFGEREQEPVFDQMCERGHQASVASIIKVSHCY